MVISVLLSVLPLLAQAPTHAAPAPPQQIVVGTDDRRDFFEASYPAVNLFASTGTIFTTGNYTLAPDGQSVALNFNSWADKFLQRNEQYTGIPFSPPRPLCSTERFLTQNSTGSCSFTLIAPNLALTAGHCMTMPRCTPGSGPNQLNTCRLEDVAASNPGGVCANTIFAFDYQANDSSGSSPLILGSHQFRRCRRAVSLQSINFFNVGTDFALVELDRPVCDRPSIPLASATPEAGDPLILMGSSFGLPQKSAPHTFIGEVTGRYPWSTAFPSGIFATSGESFNGNSGGGLFNLSGQLVALLTASDARNFIERRPTGPACFEFRRYAEACDRLPSGDPGACFPTFSQPVSTLPSELLPPSLPNQAEGFCQVSAIKSVIATNNASYRHALAPDSLATLFGANLWPAAPWTATNLPFPQVTEQLEVRVNGVRAGLQYISATQINFPCASLGRPHRWPTLGAHRCHLPWPHHRLTTERAHPPRRARPICFKRLRPRAAP